MTAVMLAVTVMCGTVMGNYQEVQAAGLSTTYPEFASDLSFLESLFMSAGVYLGLDTFLRTQDDIDYWNKWHELPNEDQLKRAQEDIERLYYGATEAYKKTHGNGSKPTPTPMITEPPAPGVTPPVTVAPINPDDVTMPDDWATMKKNATDKGVLAMGAATAYCVKEAVKGWWDDIISPEKDGGTYQDNPCAGLYKQVGYFHYKYYVESWNMTCETYQYIYNVNGNCEFKLYIKDDSNGFSLYTSDSSSNYKVYGVYYKNGNLSSTSTDNLGAVSTPYKLLSLDYSLNNSYYLNNELQPGDLTKSSLWPSTDTNDDYNNNNSLPSPSYPNLAVPSITLPTLDEIKDLWKQGSDDEENRPTYVTNFITNHTVQPTPEPEPTKKPEVNPNPGGGTDPDPKPSASPTPAVNPDPGGGTDPQPSGTPDPNPDPDPGGGSTDPDNPENPTPEEEASPYKADLREVFPFCIPFDLIHLLKVFDAEPEAPVFKFPLDLELDNPWTGEKVVDYHHEFEFDFSDYEDLIKLLRIIQIVAFITGLMMITRQQMIKG